MCVCNKLHLFDCDWSSRVIFLLVECCWSRRSSRQMLLPLRIRGHEFQLAFVYYYIWSQDYDIISVLLVGGAIPPSSNTCFAMVWSSHDHTACGSGALYDSGASGVSGTSGFVSGDFLRPAPWWTCPLSFSSTFSSIGSTPHSE